jgi:hypothetical protein
VSLAAGFIARRASQTRGLQLLERLPNFLIIGAMKSGTTSLALWLGFHSNLFMVPKKELHFFEQEYARGLAWYGSHFAAVKAEKAVGEATPNYMYSPEAMERIRKDLPESRLIVLLRNPAERAYSHYWHNRARSHEELEFEAAIDAEPARLAKADSDGRMQYSYVDRGYYMRQIDSILSLFPRSQLMVAFLEDLERQPVETFKSACRFLGIDESEVPAEVGKAWNVYVTQRSTMLRRVGRRLPKPLRKLMREVNVHEGKYPDMAPPTRQHLVRLYAADVSRLEAFTGRDLTAWKS